MTRTEVERTACSLMALMYHSRRDYAQPSDGFCSRCQGRCQAIGFDYAHSGLTLAFMLDALLLWFEHNNVKADEVVLREVRALIPPAALEAAGIL